MAFLKEAQRATEIVVLIEMPTVIDGCMVETTSQFLDESKLYSGNLNQYLEPYLNQKCEPSRICKVKLD